MPESNNIRILRLNKGDEIISSLLKYCDEEKIDSAWIWGIGAVSSADLSAYDLDNKKYIEKSLKENLEISSLTGNIGQYEGKAVAHLHAVFSDWKTNSFGGHLNKAIVSATCEIILNVLNFKIVRKHDDEIGLNLIIS